MDSNIFLILVKCYIICGRRGWALKDIHKFVSYAEIKWNSEFENLAVDSTHKWKDTATCLNLILDHYHDGILDKSFYNAISGVPTFKILVNDSEDLISPNFRTWQMLNQVRKEGCNMNIIFLLNADQTIRLLKFSDKKYRLKEIYELSTVPYPAPIKGALVTLRLDLWSKRKFQKQTNLYRDKVSDLQGNLLKVVTFNYIPSAIKNTHDNKNDENSGYNKGLEIEVLKSLGKAMNFIPMIYEPMNWRTEQWGKKQLDGTLSGLLGEVWSARADLALGNLHYTPYHLNILDLSIPYNTECLTFLTFESKTDNSWKTLILPFKLNMWVGVIITLFVGGFLFYALATAHEHIEDSENIVEIINDANNKQSCGEEKKDPTATKENITIKYVLSVFKNMFKKSKIPKQNKFIMNYTHNKILEMPENDVVGLYLFENIENSILYTYGMLMAVSLPKVPSGWAIRILTGWWWIYCLLVTVAYKASMTAILANPDTRITIDTLEALADTNVDCGGWGEQSKEFFKTSLDKTEQRVGQMFREVYDVAEAIDMVSKGQFAYYDNIHYLRYIKVMQKNTINKPTLQSINGTLNGTGNGDFTLHIMSNCIINMPISLGLQKNSPIKPAVDRFLRRVIEAGLVKKWLNDVMLDTIILEDPLKIEEVKALMDLKKLYGAFVVLVSGYILSIFVLLLEISYWYGVVKRDPLFDEYSINC